MACWNDCKFRQQQPFAGYCYWYSGRLHRAEAVSQYAQYNRQSLDQPDTYRNSRRCNSGACNQANQKRNKIVPFFKQQYGIYQSSFHSKQRRAEQYAAGTAANDGF